MLKSRFDELFQINSFNQRENFLSGLGYEWPLDTERADISIPAPDWVAYKNSPPTYHLC